MTVQNEKGECLTLTCVRKHGSEYILSINGFEVYESEFESYYERVVGDKPRKIIYGAEMLVGLFLAFGVFTVFSLWVSLVNQGLMHC